jgi:hypothetical protein
MASETKFTPGPWSRSEDDEWRIDGPDVASGIAVCDVKNAADWPECEGATPENIAECEANANLIAAAPDLFAQLEACVESIERMADRLQGEHPTAMSLWRSRSEAGRSALKKAKGL